MGVSTFPVCAPGREENPATPPGREKGGEAGLWMPWSDCTIGSGWLVQGFRSCAALGLSVWQPTRYGCGFARPLKPRPGGGCPWMRRAGEPIRRDCSVLAGGLGPLAGFIRPRQGSAAFGVNGLPRWWDGPLGAGRELVDVHCFGAGPEAVPVNGWVALTSYSVCTTSERGALRGIGGRDVLGTPVASGDSTCMRVRSRVFVRWRPCRGRFAICR